MAIQTIDIASSQYLHIYCENQVKIINLKDKIGLYYTLNYSTKFNSSWIDVTTLVDVDLIGFENNNIFIYNDSGGSITIQYEDNDANSIPPLVLDPPPNPILPTMNTMILETNLNNFCSYISAYEYTDGDFSILTQNCVNTLTDCFFTFRVITDNGSIVKIKDADDNIIEPAINNPQNQYIDNITSLSELMIDFNDRYAVGSIRVEQDGITVLEDTGGDYRIIKDYSNFLFHEVTAEGDQAAPILFFSTEGLNYGYIANVAVCVFSHGLNILKVLEAPLKCEGDLQSLSCDLTNLSTDATTTIGGDAGSKTIQLSFDASIPNGTYYCVKATATLENGHHNTIGMLAILDDNYGKIINMLIQGDLNINSIELMADDNSLYPKTTYINAIGIDNIQTMQKMSLDLNNGVSNNLTIKENNEDRFVFSSTTQHIYKDYNEIDIQNKAYPILFFLIDNNKIETYSDTTCILLNHGVNQINFEIPILNNAKEEEIVSLEVTIRHIKPYQYGQLIENYSGDIIGKYVNISISDELETGTFICIECTVTLNNGMNSTTKMVGKVI